MRTIVQRIPFLRLTVAFAVGIAAASFFQLPLFILFTSAGLNLILLLIIHTNYCYKLEPCFGAGVSILFMLVGILLGLYYNKAPEFNKFDFYTAVLDESPVEKEKSFACCMTLTEGYTLNKTTRQNEKIMAYFSPEHRVHLLKAGDVILFRPHPELIGPGGNPYGFDYKSYMARKKIYRQVYLSSGRWFSTGHSHTTPLILAEKMRNIVLDSFRKNIHGSRFDILSALTLGYKKELDPEVRQVFSSAGAMHVLAVSGLHVGIIFIVFSTFFAFLRMRRTGRIIFAGSALLLLWLYAFVTGLSPSVSRAATMFSFFIIGTSLNRQVNIYNTLAASAFFLLLINPNSLFDVSFQLSYSALFGIVYLQPIFEKAIEFNHKLPRYIWQLFTVSVAAQLATAPIVLYYFNQWPVYGFLSSLFLIPAVSVLIPFAFFTVAIGNIPVAGHIAYALVGGATEIMYEALKIIDRLPGAVIEIPFNISALILSLCLLISFLYWMHNFKAASFKWMLFFVLLLFTGSSVFRIQQITKHEIIISHSSGQPVLHLIKGQENYVLSEKELNEKDFALVQVMEIKRKLGLAQPTAILSYRKLYNDRNLLVNNGMILFGNKLIVCHPCNKLLPQNIVPDIEINPSDKNIFVPGKKTIKVLTELPANEKFGTGVDIYNTRTRGAFVMKW